MLIFLSLNLVFFLMFFEKKKMATKHFFLFSLFLKKETVLINGKQTSP